jgi:hypothetical protein
MRDPEFSVRGWTQEDIALPSVARTAAATGALLTNMQARGILLLVDITAVGGSPGSITSVNVQAQIGANYKTIYAFTGLTTLNAVGQFAFCIYPGAASAGSWQAAPIQGPMPRHFRVTTTHADANSTTYSVTVVYLP